MPAVSTAKVPNVAAPAAAWNRLSGLSTSVAVKVPVAVLGTASSSTVPAVVPPITAGVFIAPKVIN